MTKLGSSVRTILVAGAAWLLLDAFTAPPAMAAKGTVMWVNPPENHGRIRKDDNATNRFVYNVAAGDTNPPGTTFQVGDRVTFTEGPGNTASDVTFDPAGEPPFPPGGDPAASSAIRPASATLGLLAVGGLYGARRRRRECD